MSSGFEDFNYLPFEDDADADQPSLQSTIHIRIQQRNGRKCLTLLTGIPDKYDKDKLVSAFRKEFHCNGAVLKSNEYGEFIQLQGDQRQKIQKFLIDNQFAKSEEIKMHGF